MAVLAAAGATLAALVASASAAAAAHAPPHILLMLGDDLGNYEVGFHNPLAITPHIDALANDGVVLERHYVYHCCGPTRTSLMTGRLPYHGNQHNGNDLNSTDGADLRMTFLPAKLKQAGYRTSMIGKSHLGARSTSHLPIHRGFDQHFGFLGGGEDHYTQVSNEDPVMGELVDLWRDHAPAIGENGTFSGYLYSREAQRVIKTHAATYGAAHPLFMYLAWHLVHAPLEVPTHYFDPKCADSPQRQLYHGMVTALDEGIGNVTSTLRQSGMYNRTLIIFSADNGGPLVTTGMSGNNYPLKGGKTNDFEGGTRAVAFIGGGFVPTTLRGSTNHAYMHVCDWYATLCRLAQVDAADSHPGIPPIDSVDQWTSLMKHSATWTDGARQEMVLSYDVTAGVGGRAPSGYNAALIQGRYKIVTGHQGASGFWTGPVHPNATGPADPRRNGTGCGAFACCDGCLYDIQSDPTEHIDLRLTMPAIYAQMHTQLLSLGNMTYQTTYIQPGVKCLSPQQAAAHYHGFRGPPCFNASNLPVVPVPPPPPPPPPGEFQLLSPDGDWCLVGKKLGMVQSEGAGCVGEAPQWDVGDAETGELQWAPGGTGSGSLCIKLHEEAGWDCAKMGSNGTSAAFNGHCSSAGGAHASNYFFLSPPGEADLVGGGAGPMQIKSHDCPELCLVRGSRPDEDGVVGLALGPCVGGGAATAWVRVL